ncbi:thioesterase II family protein [Streptomyces sp. NPDC050418]|uniref:thioesterase II family protein n=1 Tax=Streptomyces sp. NPDC050418 TaxID=3365612 RepID=UPI0037AF110F
MQRYLAVRPQAEPAGMRLLCFHHAGAGALAFAGWRQRVGQEVDVLPVRLPGRETRRGEPHLTDPGTLLAGLQDDLGPLLDEGPYAFYGHSMGALVAYRFALYRADTGQRPPSALLVGACSAPQLGSELLDRTDLDDLTDTDLMAAMTDEESLPPVLLRSPERLRATLDTLRADLRLARALRALPVRRLASPLWAFAGRRDRIAPAGQVGEWRYCAGAGFMLQTVPGAHFFVRGREAPRAVGQALLTTTPVPAR